MSGVNQAIANRLRVHRLTFTKTIRDAHRDNSDILREGEHYKFTGNNQVQVLDPIAIVPAFRLYVACKDGKGVTVTQFSKIQWLNARRVRQFIEDNQESLLSENIVVRSCKGWRILAPTVFTEMFDDSL